MGKALHHCNLTVVDLQDNIRVSTVIPQALHSALRSGFAGCPVNPRWTVDKYHAWKMGRQLRDEWEQGKLIVRKTDLMLVSAAEVRSESPRKLYFGLIRPISTWSKNILTAMAIA